MNIILENKRKVLAAVICLLLLVIYGCTLLPSKGLRALKNEVELIENIASAKVIYRRDRDSHTPLIGGMSKPHSAKIIIKFEPNAGYSSDELANDIKDILITSSWKENDGIKNYSSLRKNYNQSEARNLLVNIFIHENSVAVEFTD